MPCCRGHPGSASWHEAGFQRRDPADAALPELAGSTPAVSFMLGCSSAGSSQAAMLGGLALKWRRRHKRQSEGNPAGQPNLVCGPVQVCWEKFAR
jgi:uncharacterized protein (TIGR03382 family)